MITALGVAVKLAAEYAETSQAQALGIFHDDTDAIVGLAAAVVSAQPRERLQADGRDSSWDGCRSNTHCGIPELVHSI